jgi:hypothetical protein
MEVKNTTKIMHKLLVMEQWDKFLQKAFDSLTEENKEKLVRVAALEQQNPLKYCSFNTILENVLEFIITSAKDDINSLSLMGVKSIRQAASTYHNRKIYRDLGLFKLRHRRVIL